MKVGDWNDVRFSVRGNHIMTWVNGVLALDYTDPAPKFSDGIIALQLHAGGEGKMRFKDLYDQALRWLFAAAQRRRRRRRRRRAATGARPAPALPALSASASACPVPARACSAAPVRERLGPVAVDFQPGQRLVDDVAMQQRALGAEWRPQVEPGATGSS